MFKRIVRKIYFGDFLFEEVDYEIERNYWEKNLLVLLEICKF